MPDNIFNLANHETQSITWLANKSRIESEIASLAEAIARYGVIEQTRERARDIVNEVLSATQKEVITVVEDLVTLALQSVYGTNHSFSLELDVTRNAASATPYVVIDGEKYSPRNEQGGGIADTVSLALRLALWALSTPRPAATFILDEPARGLGSEQKKFGLLLQKLNSLLGIQFIIVSHDRRIIEYADKSWSVEKKDGVSIVTETTETTTE